MAEIYRLTGSIEALKRFSALLDWGMIYRSSDVFIN